MGTSWCSSRPNFEPQTSRNKIEEAQILEKIFKFDFNKDNQGDISFEEFLQSNLTNDFGDLANPHFTILALAEFRKFIFLWFMNIKEINKKSFKPYETIKENGVEVKYFKALTAPPLIDLVWRWMIQRHKIYNSLWNEIFDGQLERKLPEDSNVSVFTDYTRTYLMADYYSDTINPSPLLWPRLSKEDLEYEFENIVWVSKKTLKTIKKIIDKKWKSSSELSDKNCRSIVSSVSNSIFKASTLTPTLPRFANIELELSSSQVFKIKNIYNKIKTQIGEKKEKALKKRISQKYLTEDDSWIEEYYKYLIVKVHSKDEVYPWLAVEKVINTHMELTTEYREFNELLNLDHGELIYYFR